LGMAVLRGLAPVRLVSPVRERASPAMGGKGGKTRPGRAGKSLAPSDEGGLASVHRAKTGEEDEMTDKTAGGKKPPVEGGNTAAPTKGGGKPMPGKGK
jgi:hypothetical protein